MIADFIKFMGSSYVPFLGETVDLFFKTVTIWAPIILIVVLWKTWLLYVRAYYIHTKEPVLLEIKLPREVYKTPKAMERILAALYRGGKPDHYVEAFWVGKVPPWFSLEMVSLGGQVHLYIWAWRQFKDLIESQFYSLYPGVEIVEAENDYASQAPPPSKDFKIWGMQFKLANPDPFPIQTYVDLGMDKPGVEEEEKDDPMGPILELLGSLRRGEQAWIQILIQAHQKEDILLGRLFPRPDWKQQCRDELQKLRDQVKMPSSGINDSFTMMQPLTMYESETAKTMQRNLDKYPFDTCVRVMYLARPEHYDGSRIPGLIGNWRQVSSTNRNGFKPSWKTEVNNPLWQDFRDKRKKMRERSYLAAYRRRAFFQEPYKYFKQKPFVLTTEELATIFHVPGTVVSTPTLQRVMSQKGDAPSNIPTEQ